jgi:hypothetical protein
VPFHRFHVSSSAGHRQAHVEHGPACFGAVLRAGVVPFHGNFISAVRDPAGADRRGAGQVRAGLRPEKAVPPRSLRCRNLLDGDASAASALVATYAIER